MQKMQRRRGLWAIFRVFLRFFLFVFEVFLLLFLLFFFFFFFFWGGGGRFVIGFVVAVFDPVHDVDLLYCYVKHHLKSVY